MTAIQEAKDLTKLSLEELIGSLMTYEIELYNHQRVEENEKSIAFMAITNDDEEEDGESESDEINSNSNHFDFQDELQKLYFNLEKLGSKNIPLKKKISCLLNELNEDNENFENIEKTKIPFEKKLGVYSQSSTPSLIYCRMAISIVKNNASGWNSI